MEKAPVARRFGYFGKMLHGQERGSGRLFYQQPVRQEFAPLIMQSPAT